MVTKWMTGIVIAGLIFGPAVAQQPEGAPATVPTRLTPKQAEVVKRVVRANLKDPESARFDRPFLGARAAAGDVMVCGYVNAKNSYGGYIGNSYFIGVLQPGGSFDLSRLASDRADNVEARGLCQAVGIALD